MKTLIVMLACWFVMDRAFATETAPKDICSSRYTGTVSQEVKVQAMRGPIEEAIATLDNARIELPSPSLASGNINYLSISPNFAEQLNKICVLGYFELTRNNEVRTIPLLVEQIEVIKAAQPHDPNQGTESTRIYFRTPRIEEFSNGHDMRGTWKFWMRHQSLQLKIAAFPYDGGQHGQAYFGRDATITVSNKSSSVFAAALFAALFYLVAATTIPSALRREMGVLAAGWRSVFRHLKPWNITGSDGQASLSQLQMLLFTLIVATLLFYQWLRTGLLQEISTDLLYLIGISTAGAAGSQVAASIKKELDTKIYQYVQQLGWFTAPLAGAHARASAAELLMTNKRFDIYKFQMLVFTFVIAAYVIASGADELGNIRISATLLALMGMSQGAYVAGRATSDSLTPLQDQLLGMQNLQDRYQASVDPQIREELRRRFVLAATQAGAMFSSIFARVLPDYLLDIPFDARS